MKKNWRYSAYSITKYNPIYRNSKHVYTKEEWTSISDVGKTYDGNVFTMQEYLETEKRYIEAIKTIMLLNNCDVLHVRKLEKYKDVLCFQDEINKDLYTYYESLKNRFAVTEHTLPPIMKIILRDLSWCELVNIEKRLYVRFGYDYHMTVNTKVPYETVKKNIERLGLYVGI